MTVLYSLKHIAFALSISMIARAIVMDSGDLKENHAYCS
jgi:hypothetical protein